MRLAVFSDIHGNAVALDAMIEDLARRPADAMVCLGRRVPYPVETLARAYRESGRPFARESLTQYGVPTG